MIDWNRHFDAIWCINFSSYSERKKRISEEFERVGISKHKNFNFYHTFDNLFDKILFDVTKNLGKSSCSKVSELNLAMAHYSCIKSSYEMGYDRILIFEDDVKIINDLKTIEDYLSHIPSDAEVVLFSQNPGLPSSIPKYLSDDKSKAKYIRFSYAIWDSGFYMLSRSAMKKIIENFEKFVAPADSYISSFRDIGEMNRYYTAKPLGIQLDYSNSINYSHMYTYANMRLDLSEYGVRYMPKEMETVSFKIIIPSFNSSNTIKRCIDSIKQQEYSNYRVVIVDDVSTDDSVKVIEREIKGDERFSLVKSDKKVFAGGARNIGIDFECESDYTLFLDSDDFYFSKYTISSIAEKIISNNGNVDCVLCPFVDMYHHNCLVWMNYSSVVDFLKVNPVYAPWVKCVKTKLVRRFDDTVSAYDDVIQHLRQMDSIKTVDFLKNIAINYSFDGKETVWNTTTLSEDKQKRLDTSLVKTITNLLNEKFEHEYVEKAAFSKFIDVNIKKALEIKNRLGI